MKKLEIKYAFTSAYNPTGNGISERINQTLATVLQHYKSVKTIHDVVKIAEKRLQLCYHRSIDCAPIDLTDHGNPLSIRHKIKVSTLENSNKISKIILEKSRKLENNKRQIE